MIAEINILINRCSSGVYLRWWHSQGGWHYLLVGTRTTNEVSAQNLDTITRERFSRLSKADAVLAKKIEANVKCGLDNLDVDQKNAVVGMLEAERVEWWRGGIWQEVEVPRQAYTIRDSRSNLYTVEFSFKQKNYLDDV